MKRIKRVIALLLTAAFVMSVLAFAPVSTAVDAGKMAVAVFSADGTAAQTVSVISEWFNSNTITADGTLITDFKVEEITVDDINGGKLSSYDTLVVADAGSSAINMGKTVMTALGTSAVTKIQDFIAAGGGYVGMGGGAFAATQSFTTGGVTSNFMNLIRYRVDYPYWNHGVGEVVINTKQVSHMITKGMQSGRKYIGFVDAPPILKTIDTSAVKDTRAGSPVSLITFYSNIRNGLGSDVNVRTSAYKNMSGTPALAAGAFGGGRVVISGVLLQSSQSVNMDFLLGRSILYAAGYNSMEAVEKSEEQTQFDVVAEWMWASEVYSKGANGAKFIAERCKNMGITDIYLQVKGLAGGVAYRKGAVPLKRTYADRDVLQEMITACHANGIRLHAWVTVLSDQEYAASHITETLYHYKRGYNSRAEGNDWSTMDPTLPNFANYTQTLLAEMVRNYDVDGVHFDYIRYNHITYGWSEANIAQMEDEYGINVATLKSYVDSTYYTNIDSAKIFRLAASAECGYAEGRDAMLFMQMRCDNIKNFAQGVVDAIRAVKSDVIISAALMAEGAYQGNQYVSGRNDNQTSSNTYGRMVFGQDFEDAAELYDYVCPMAYSFTYSASYQWMAAIAQSAANMGNKVVMGLQAFNDGEGRVTSKTMMGEIEQIRKVASDDILGIAFFRTGLFSYIKNTYSESQNLVEVEIANGFAGENLIKVVIEMQDGLTAKSVAGYENIAGVTASISADGKTVTLSKSTLVPALENVSIFLNVEGKLNRTLGPCFVNIYSADYETRSYQTYEEGIVELPPPPTPLPTIAGRSTFTMQQVLDAMTQINEKAESSSGNLPTSIVINGTTVSKASYMRLACAAVYNATLGVSRDALVSYVPCKEPTGSTSNTFDSTTISRDGYLYFADRQLAYIDSHNSMPAGYTSYPGVSGLTYSGTLNYDNGTRVLVRALAFYNKYNVLPDSLSTAKIAASTPTPPPATPVPTPTLKPTATPTPAPTATPTPAPTATPTANPTASYELGDATMDGKINSRDIAAVQKHIMGTEMLGTEGQAFADLNKDNKINSRDIAAVQAIVLGRD